MGVEVTVDGLSKSFGPQNIWDDMSLNLPPEAQAGILAGLEPADRARYSTGPTTSLRGDGR